MTVLWGREYRVTVDDVQTDQQTCVFKATKTLEPEPNTADLIVYNFRPDRRRQMSMVSGGPYVEIVAGYRGNAGRIFKGQLREVSSFKQGSEWVTELHSGDGEKRFSEARINKSYAKGTKVDVIIRDVARELGLGLGNAVRQAASGNLTEAGREFLNGAVFSGQAAKEFSRILKSVGKEWSIQDGELQLLPMGTCLPGPTIRIDAQHGLIGSPTVGSDGVLKFRCLMNHEIVPGRALEVESSEVSKAFYRAERCEYSGDTAGQDWYVDVEAVLYVPALYTF